MQSMAGTRAWIESNRDLCIEALRIYLGIGLLIKGFNFLFGNSIISDLMTNSPSLPFFEFLSLHYIGLAHIFGGALLAVGLLTRAAALVQIPILFGAVLFVSGPQGLFAAEQSLEFTLLVLFLLIIFAIYGPGRISVDSLLARRRIAVNPND